MLLALTVDGVRKAHNTVMSRAFVKEDAGERWTPPATPCEYRVVLDEEKLHETNDLLDALNWLYARPSGGFELRTKDGQLLARS